MSTETYEYEKINAKDKPIAEDFVYVYSEIEDGGFRKVSKAMLKVLLGVATKLSELENDKAFITKTVLDLENYYLKSDTYSKDEIDNRISLIPRFDVQVVSSLPTTNISETTVYLVSSGDDSDNLYTEYINVNGLWEILGTQKIASVENAVLYTEQSLTEEQKTQARTNISAASSEEVRQVQQQIADKESMLYAEGVDWNYPELDIWNAYRMRNAKLLSTEGNMAHNACACLCDGVIANVWTENTDGGTGDNFNSAGVHSKLRFTYDFYGIGWKSLDWNLNLDSTTYDIFPEGTEITGLDGNTYTVVTDSDNMILYVNSTLHIFSMVKGSDGKVHFVHTSGTVSLSSKVVTWTPSNVFTEISLIVDGVSGAYDFKRINSEWESPQINTHPNVGDNTTEIALSINGKGIVFLSFPNSDVTKWTYKSFIERTDIYLEASMKRLSYVSASYPTIAIAYRTKKGYAKILGLNNNYEVLQEYAIPASNTRVTLLFSDGNLFLIVGDNGRSSASIYMYNLVGTPSLSKPVKICNLDSNITDYVSGFIGGNISSRYLYLIGTNGFAQNKGGVYCNTFIYDTKNAEYIKYANRMYEMIKNDIIALINARVTNPSVGTIGQILEIASVDSSGKPLTYQAVDKPETGTANAVILESTGGTKFMLTISDDGVINPINLTEDETLVCELGTIDGDTGEEQEITNRFRTEFVEIYNGGEIEVINNSNYLFIFRAFDSNHNFVGKIQPNYGWDGSALSGWCSGSGKIDVSTISGAKYLRIVFRNQNDSDIVSPISGTITIGYKRYTLSGITT